MTALDMVTTLKSQIDEYGATASQPARFWNDPADYLDALNEAQREVLNDMLGGDDRDFRGCRALTVRETVTDGGTLASHCYLPLSATDAANRQRVTLHFAQQYRAYQNVTQTLFGQVEVDADTVRTIPAGGTYDVVYVRYPAAIVVDYAVPANDVDSEFSPVYHSTVVERARMIMIRKDIESPLDENIEAERNKLEVYQQAKKQQAPGFRPRALPYSER